MQGRYRIRTVIGYVAESLRYADTLEEAEEIAEQQEQKYNRYTIVEDREVERMMHRMRRTAG